MGRGARRFLGVAIGLSGAAGLVLCAAGVVGCWLLRAEIVSRVNRALGRCEDSIAEMQAIRIRASDQLGQARAELEAFRRRVADSAASPPRVVRRARFREAVERASPQLAEARRLLVRATETALVIDGFLEAVAELVPGDRIGLDPFRLRHASDELSDLIKKCERLTALLPGDAPDIASEDEESSARLTESLGKVIALVDEGVAPSARDRVAALRIRITRLLTVAAAACTLILLWVGAGQLSLMIHGRGWSRKS